MYFVIFFSSVTISLVTCPSLSINSATAGARPKVRRRLRSRKMALWRDLIPRLHRAGNWGAT